MGRKIGFGLLWFIGIYLASCILIGAIAGGFAGVEHPHDAYAAGQTAGANIVAAWRPYLFFGSLAIAVVGAIKGFLPGTKSRNASSSGSA
jgi:hypothetical protein